MPSHKTACRYEIIAHEPGRIELVFIGDWIIGNTLPSVTQVTAELQRYAVTDIFLNGALSLGRWDSRLVAFVSGIVGVLGQKNIKIDLSGLPKGVCGLVDLAKAVPRSETTSKTEQRESFQYQLGNKGIEVVREVKDILVFTGEAWLSIVRFTSGKSCFRSGDFWLIVQECGPNALPIVTLISMLIGLILAFVGAIQLRMFGADIYIANLVALGMVREMGAMMTAIIMAGRTGAAYAAQLGTMQVNEEIDAFKTMGIIPMDFLVLPRMLALILMMPLLTLYADFLGIMGGLVVGVGLLDLSFIEYYHQTVGSIKLLDCATGLIKSTVFGVLVALSGCMSGMQCGRSSSAVGKAATSAVVSGIVSIVVADSVLTVVYDSLKI